MSCNLAYNINWSNPTLSSILERELNKLIEYYISNPNIEPCTILNQEIDGLALVDFENPIRKSYCGAGINMKAYDLNGDAYPCQFYLLERKNQMLLKVCIFIMIQSQKN